MPEEKKDSFTFSDKIKSSKPVASKSFGNRISSKIGSNGKPKKTLFERTKRDAPFFIAAIVALLLLPFLYKYSGQVNEEPIATPGSEESVFDPERYGFDTTTTDPDGQIAQLAGRDPLSLIKGWGSPEPDQPVYDAIPPHDGMEDGYTPPPVTESNTNNFRSNAPAATRAAFRRSATKIKELGNAGMASRGGGQLAVGPWGGSLKKAASRVGGPAGPRQGPKPVSLQPLQAAGKPSRSYFGQGAAAEARRSKDALSKGNAMQALMDAQMRPITPGKIGGLGGTDYRGGGNGDLKHAFSYNGLKPWWWDLMAQKHMHDWMWKRNLWQKPITMLVEGLAKGLVDMFSGIVGCLLTGEDDFAMGSMFGASASGGTAAGCKIQGKGDPMSVDQACGGDNYDFERCGGTKDKPNAKVYKQWCKNGGGTWEDGKGAGGNLNAWQKRMWCLGNTVKGSKGKASYGLDARCVDFHKRNIYNAYLDANRDISKWAVYHYVVGVKQADVAKYYKQISLADRNAMLEVFYMDKGTSFNPTITDAYKKAVANHKMVPMFVESIALKKPLKNTDKDKSSDEDKIASANELVFGSKSLPMSYNAFRQAFETGRNFLKDSAKEKAVKAGREGKDWVAGAQCTFPLVHVKCPYNAEVKLSKDKNGTAYPYATVIMSDGVLAQYDQLRDNISVWYSVQKVVGDTKTFPITQPDAVKINHFNPKAYGKSRENPTAANRRGAAFSDPTLSGEAGAEENNNAFDVYATKGIKPGEPTTIRWYIQQGEGVNEGKNNIGIVKQRDGDKVIGEGLAVPGETVSIAECTYYNDGQEDAVSEQTASGDKDKGSTNTGNLNVTGTRSGAGDSAVPQTRLAAKMAEIPANYTDRSTDDAKPLSSGKKFLNTSMGNCKDGENLDNRSFSYKPMVTFVQNVVNAYNKQAEAQKQPKIMFSGNQVSVPEFVDALNIAQSMDAKKEIEKVTVALLGKSFAVASKDPQVRTKDNTFGALMMYIDANSSYYPTPKTRENGQIVYDKRFYGCKNKAEVTPPGKEYHYGHYNWAGNRAPYEAIINKQTSFPLQALAVPGFTRDTNVKKAGLCNIDQKNRLAYHKAYGPMLTGNARGLSAIYGNATMPVANVLTYVQEVCTNGLSYKPQTGNPRDCKVECKEPNFAGEATVSDL